MNIERAKLKIRAKEIMRSSEPGVVSVGFVYILLGVLFSVLSTGVLGSNISPSDYSQIMEHIRSGNLEFAVVYMQRFLPPASAYAVKSALDLVFQIVSVGFIIFLINTIRRTAPCYGNLLDGFGMIFRVIFLYFMEGLFIFLWCLLLVVPGIIAAYRYRQAIYLLIDHPEMTVLDCIRESKEMMRGKKWELFVLDLSFLGWSLLAMMPVIGWASQVWSIPYMEMTYALYYETLCGKDVFEGASGYSTDRDFNF